MTNRNNPKPCLPKYVPYMIDKRGRLVTSLPGRHQLQLAYLEGFTSAVFNAIDTVCDTYLDELSLNGRENRKQ